ncbi:MAG: hypothetical protein PHE53_01210 [Thermoguttaceae bacterium]|nr:hypothetical protein [Thermoguttaceae bacterium]
MRRAFSIVLVGFVIFRIAILWVGAVQGFAFSDDPDAYRALAENFLNTGTFGNGEIPTAYRPPLYPMLLVPAVQLGRLCQSEMVFRLSVAMLHSFLILLTLVATWRLAWRLFAQPQNADDGENVKNTLRTKDSHNTKNVSSIADDAVAVRPQAVRSGWCGWLAVAGVAFDPVLVQQSTQLMTETTAVFFAAILLLLGNPVIESTDSNGWIRISWWRVPLTGLLFGLATLCRPAFLPFCGVMTLLYLIPILCNPLLRKTLCEWNPLYRTARSYSHTHQARKKTQATQDAISAMNLLRTILAWGVFVLCGLLVLLVWGGRNRICFGHSIWTTTHGGYTLLLGNNPDFYEWLRHGDTTQPWNAERLQREIARRNPYTAGIPLGMPDPSGRIRTPENLAIPQRTAIQRSKPVPEHITTETSESIPVAKSDSFSTSAPDRAAEETTYLTHMPKIRVEQVTGELALDVQLTRWAKRTIREDPQGFGLAIVWRLSRFLGIKSLGPPVDSPLRAVLGWGIAVYYTLEWGLIGLAILGVFYDWWCRKGRRSVCGVKTFGSDSESAFACWLSGWILIGVTVSVHTLYWTDMRMRAVLVPILVLLAVRGVLCSSRFRPKCLQSQVSS